MVILVCNPLYPHFFLLIPHAASFSVRNVNTLLSTRPEWRITSVQNTRMSYWSSKRSVLCNNLYKYSIRPKKGHGYHYGGYDILMDSDGIPVGWKPLKHEWIKSFQSSASATTTSDNVTVRWSAFSITCYIETSNNCTWCRHGALLAWKLLLKNVYLSPTKLNVILGLFWYSLAIE